MISHFSLCIAIIWLQFIRWYPKWNLHRPTQFSLHCVTTRHAEATSEPSSDKSATEPALQLLKDNLPSYIVSCFLASGYDTLPVIAEMDASDGPGNAIQSIEDFINEQYPGDPLYTRGRKVCKFPPGHRIRIKRFVELVKEKNREPESKMTFHIKQSKRLK